MNLLLRKKVDSWLKESIIDNETHSRILSFEENKFSLSGNHFILGLGTVSIAVGIISVVAANWYILTKETKIISNIIMLLFLAIMTYLSEKKNYKVLLEIFCTLYFVSIIATFALIGQIYNITNETFLTLSYWLLLGTPLIVLTKTKYAAYFYSTIVLVWAINGVIYIDKYSKAQTTFLILVPITIFYISLIFKNIDKKEISNALMKFSQFSLSVIFLIIAPILWRDIYKHNYSPLIQNSIIILTASLPLFFYIIKKYSFRWFSIALLIFLFIQIPSAFVIGDQKEISALFFLTIWSAIAYLAYESKNQKLFDVSFLIISLRIIIIYFEVFGSLLDTGIGLIGSGCFLITIFYLWNSNRKTIWKKLVQNEK